MGEKFAGNVGEGLNGKRKQIVVHEEGDDAVMISRFLLFEQVSDRHLKDSKHAPPPCV